MRRNGLFRGALIGFDSPRPVGLMAGGSFEAEISVTNMAPKWQYYHKARQKATICENRRTR